MSIEDVNTSAEFGTAMLLEYVKKRTDYIRMACYAISEESVIALAKKPKVSVGTVGKNYVFSALKEATENLITSFRTLLK